VEFWTGAHTQEMGVVYMPLRAAAAVGFADLPVVGLFPAKGQLD